MANTLVAKETQTGYRHHEDIAAADFVLRLLDFRTQFYQILTEEAYGFASPLHQRMADKQLATQRRVNLALIIHLARGDDRQT